MFATRRLSQLTLKPVLACTANCPGCASRRLLHREARGEAALDFAAWRGLLEEGRALGARHLTISGGEPTLYDRLPELVAAGAGLGYRVVLNTNGSLDELLGLFRELGSEEVLLSYLEGDFDGRLQVGAAEIREFRAVVLPRAVAACATLPGSVRGTAVACLEGLFAPEVAPAEGFAQGRYRGGGSCPVLGRDLLVLANGDVHPCPIVEYTHEPVLGNLLRQPLRRILRSTQWRRVEAALGEGCSRCPIPLHTTIPLAEPFPET